MPLNKGTLSGVSWLMAGRLGSVALSAISNAVLARLLTPGEFGTVAAALMVTTFAAAIFESSYGLNLIRRNTTRPEDIRTTLTFGILLSGTAYGIIVLTAPRVEAFFGFDGLGLLLTVLGLTLPMRCVLSVATSQLQIEGRFNLMARAVFIATFVGSLLFGVPMGILGFGIWALATATLVTSALECAMLVRPARLSFKPMIDRQALREIFSTSIFNLATILNSFANNALTAIVGRSLGESSLGIYSRASKLLELFVSATAAQMARVFIPLYSQSREDPDSGQATMKAVLDVLYPIYAVISLLAVLHAPFVVALLLGEQWDQAAPVAAVLFASIFPRCIAKAYQNYSVANGVLHASASRQGIYAGAMVIGAWIAVPYGLVAIAVSALAAVWLLYLLSMTYAVRISGLAWRHIAALHLRLPVLLIPVGVADYSVLRMLDDYPLLLAHALSGCIGAVVLLVMSVLSPEAFVGRDWGARLRSARIRALSRLANAARSIRRGHMGRSTP